MNKLTKNRKNAFSKIEIDNKYSLSDAVKLVKETSSEKFDASVDLAVKLGVDPKQANQMVRGVVSLPHGTGKETKIVVICQSDKQEEAKTAGAYFVGYEDLLENPEKEFFKIAKFMEKLMDCKFEEEKINNAINSTSFQTLQKLEEKGLFTKKTMCFSKKGRPQGNGDKTDLRLFSKNQD